MERFSKSPRKVMSLAMVAGTLTVGLSGIVHAQLNNPEIKSTKEAAAGSNKPNEKNNSARKGKKTSEKKRLKQGSGKNAQNYKGAQSPQGGRLGQGGFE